MLFDRILLHHIQSQIRFHATVVTMKDHSNIIETLRAINISELICGSVLHSFISCLFNPSQCFYYVIGLRHHTALNRQQCISNGNTQGYMPFQWCHVQSVMPYVRTMPSFFFERQWAAASSFSICEMYTCNTGLCCSVAMALTQGRGFESHCGYPLWKYAHSLHFNAI